jgi:hypothetical protein
MALHRKASASQLPRLCARTVQTCRTPPALPGGQAWHPFQHFLVEDRPPEVSGAPDPAVLPHALTRVMSFSHPDSHFAATGRRVSQLDTRRWSMVGISRRLKRCRMNACRWYCRRPAGRAVGQQNSERVSYLDRLPTGAPRPLRVPVESGYRRSLGSLLHSLYRSPRRTTRPGCGGRLTEWSVRFRALRRWPVQQCDSAGR